MPSSAAIAPAAERDSLLHVVASRGDTAISSSRARP
jgi:hypothetical protein